eukprot:364591-Chlamydomonas_euryale.AAC.11
MHLPECAACTCQHAPHAPARMRAKGTHLPHIRCAHAHAPPLMLQERGTRVASSVGQRGDRPDIRDKRRHAPG